MLKCHRIKSLLNNLQMCYLPYTVSDIYSLLYFNSKYGLSPQKLESECNLSPKVLFMKCNCTGRLHRCRVHFFALFGVQSVKCGSGNIK